MEWWAFVSVNKYSNIFTLGLQALLGIFSLISDLSREDVTSGEDLSKHVSNRSCFGNKFAFAHTQLAHTHTQARTHTYTRTCTHTHAHTYTHTDACTHAHTYTHTDARTHGRTHARTHAHTHTHTHTHALVSHDDEEIPHLTVV